jgi:NhaP-type Na+/H+ or K+/H+ antiporter
VHWAVAVVALTLLAFAAISGRIAGTPVTAAMVFTAVGLIVGSEALGLIDVPPTGETVKLLAEATLALVLFADASRIDVGALHGELSVPLRLLGIGLPLTLVSGFLVALIVFPQL